LLNPFTLCPLSLFFFPSLYSCLIIPVSPSLSSTYQCISVIRVLPFTLLSLSFTEPHTLLRTFGKSSFILFSLTSLTLSFFQPFIFTFLFSSIETIAGFVPRLLNTVGSSI
jgi:hypothetical protein